MLVKVGDQRARASVGQRLFERAKRGGVALEEVAVGGGVGQVMGSEGGIDPVMGVAGCRLQGSSCAQAGLPNTRSKIRSTRLR